MSAKYPSDIVEQAQAVLAAWKQIEDGPAIGPVTTMIMANNITQVTDILPRIDASEAQLTSLRNERDELCEALWDKVKRVRSGVKANYGDDSSEYEMVGGTRASERKPATRRVKTPA